MLDLGEAGVGRIRHILVREYAVGADDAHDCHEVLGRVYAKYGDAGALRDADCDKRFSKLN